MRRSGRPVWGGWGPPRRPPASGGRRSHTRGSAAEPQGVAGRGGGGTAFAGLAVLALGKLGSRELNYSSDVDLILLFDPDTLPRRSRDGAGGAAGGARRRG